jgi:hypothetical protein
VSSASLWEAARRYVDAGFSLEVFVVVLTSVSSCESLNSVRTYVRLVCEWGHRDPAFHGLSGVSTRFALEDQNKFGNGPRTVAFHSEARIKGQIEGAAVAFER